jgi:SAM-dependent methyltransferase
MPTHRERILDQFRCQALPFSNSPAMNDGDALAARAGPADVVLDVGCGPGIVVCAFAAIARHVTGIDVTPAMLERARQLAAQRRLKNVTFLPADANSLPFPNRSFDIVVSRFAFHHFPDPGEVLAEMKRVCRLGGRVIVADMVTSGEPGRDAAFHAMEILRDPSHARARSLAELHTLFHDTGLAGPDEIHWTFDVDLDRLLACSFPAEGAEPIIRRMFDESMTNDAMGLAVRREGGCIRFTYRNVILVARQY